MSSGTLRGWSASARALRVGEDHRRAAGLERVAHGVVADVAQVDEHAEAVHLVDDGAAEIGEAVIFRIVGGAVGPFVVLEVGEGHVARAELVELPQRGEAAADLVPALDPDQRSDFAGLVDAHDVVRGAGQREVVGIGFDQPLDDVDLLDRLADRGVAGDFGRDVDRPELRPDAALRGAAPCRSSAGAARWSVPLARPVDAEAVILAQLLRRGRCARRSAASP